MALGAHWSHLELNAQPPPGHNDLVGLVDPGFRTHTAPSKCVIHNRGNSLRPTLLTILRDLQRVEGAYQKRVGERQD